MLQLRANGLEVRCLPSETGSFVARVSANPHLPSVLRRAQLYLGSPVGAPPGFRAYLAFGAGDDSATAARPLVVLPDSLSYLRDGDVVRLDLGNRRLHVLFRRSSHSNSLLLTEQCNNYCLMCSQPPKRPSDRWLVEEALDVIRLVDPEARALGLTGGEPTLLGDDLLRIIAATKAYLPRTGLHLLTNGRAFADPEYAEKYAGVDHPDLVAGIPLYADLAEIHDYVVQAKGAFDETIRGVLNLKRLKQRVEIRVVLHKQTIPRLTQLAEFLARNLTFVDHIALMGLEMTGFTLANLDDLWIDPFDYRRELREAVEILAAHRMNVSVYNHQLCLMDEAIWPFARKSISDWKNEYFTECDACALAQDCGGFFSSARHRYSSHIRPIPRSAAP